MRVRWAHSDRRSTIFPKKLEINENADGMSYGRKRIGRETTTTAVPLDAILLASRSRTLVDAQLFFTLQKLERPFVRPQLSLFTPKFVNQVQGFPLALFERKLAGVLLSLHGLVGRWISTWERSSHFPDRSQGGDCGWNTILSDLRLWEDIWVVFDLLQCSHSFEDAPSFVRRSH
jgi:hypothetical protein